MVVEFPEYTDLRTGSGQGPYQDDSLLPHSSRRQMVDGRDILQVLNKNVIVRAVQVDQSRTENAHEKVVSIGSIASEAMSEGSRAWHKDLDGSDGGTHLRGFPGSVGYLRSQQLSVCDDSRDILVPDCCFQE